MEVGGRIWINEDDDQPCPIVEIEEGDEYIIVYMIRKGKRICRHYKWDEEVWYDEHDRTSDIFYV